MHAIKHIIDIDAPAEVVYRLVSTPTGMAEWWSDDVSADPASGAVEVAFFNRTTIYRFLPEAMTPEKCVTWLCDAGKEWQGTKLVFELLGARDQASVHFVHEGWREATDYFIGCNTVWGALMFRLKAAAEGKSPGPLFSREGMND
jgi:uncharacterized protein YndB with AHSA1/START domain